MVQKFYFSKVHVSELDLSNTEYNRTLLKKAIIFTLLWGLFAHGFSFFGIFPSHDSLFDFFLGPANRNVYITHGRVLLPFYADLAANKYILPWSNGLISLTWIGLSCFLICKMFRLDRTIEILMVAGLMTTNRSVFALYATYSMCAGPYYLSLLLSVSAAFLWHQSLKTKNLSFLMISAICLAISIGLYQAYIAVTLVLIIFASILDLLNGEPVGQVFKNGLLAIGAILISGILYWLLSTLIISFLGLALNSKDHNTMAAALQSTEPIFAKIIYAYSETFNCFFNNVFTIYPRKIIIGINGILAVIGTALLAVSSKNKKLTPLAVILTVVLTLILPLAVYILRFLVVEVHDLMITSVWLLYLLPYLLLKQTKKPTKHLYILLFSCLFFLDFCNVQTANLGYVQKKMQYDATFSIMTNVSHDIECQENYIPGETPVVFIGSPANIQSSLPGHERLWRITGFETVSPISYYMQQYFSYVLQRDANVILKKDSKIPKEAFQTPHYPLLGYISMIDGTMYVHLS